MAEFKIRPLYLNVFPIVPILSLIKNPPLLTFTFKFQHRHRLKVNSLSLLPPLSIYFSPSFSSLYRYSAFSTQKL